MCFSQSGSFSFAALGLFASIWIYTRTNNGALASGVFFFFTMELLQGFQYFVIAKDLKDPACDTFINQFLTLLGFAHICLQPYFTHLINSSLTRSERYLWQYKVVLRLSLCAGALLFGRFVIAYLKISIPLLNMAAQWTSRSRAAPIRARALNGCAARSSAPSTASITSRGACRWPTRRI